MDLREGTGDEQLIGQVAQQARVADLTLTGQDGLRARLARTVIERALKGEMDTHLGCARHERAEGDDGTGRKGTRSKTLLTMIGPVEIDTPCDRDASFDRQIVRKW